MSAGPVGYYVHHEGAGHGALGTALSNVLGEAIVGLGSGGRPAGWQGRWIDLPPDATPPVAPDPTRGGAWHWAPAHHPGFAARMRTIARWVDEERPAALVSDVSCEVAALGALLGVPTAAVVMHGRRDDRPHRTAWDSVDALVGPWPATHTDRALAPWSAKVTALGLTSRFDGRTRTARAEGRTVLVLLPSGGHGIDAAGIDAAARATPGWRWTVAGAAPPGAAIGSGGTPRDLVARRPGGVRWVGRVDDPWPLLGAAQVVVAACGSGSVADIAAARRAAVLLPQERPFDEQQALAACIGGTAPVVIAGRWPAVDDWAEVLDRAAGLDVGRWDALHDGRGAHRYADLIAGLAPPGFTAHR